MIIELSEFFNNPSIIEIGSLKIQYYAVTWLLSAVFIYLFLSRNKIITEIGLSNDDVNDMGFSLEQCVAEELVICFFTELTS